MTNNTFTLDYNVTGADRKRLVNAIASHTQTDAKYLGAPSFAYEVDYFTIDRNGCVSFDDRADSAEIEGLIEVLAVQGFVTATSNLGLPEEQAPTTPTETDTGNTVGLTVTIPLDKVSLGNLTALLDAKGNLIHKALGIDATPIEVGEDTVSFPWFENALQPNEVKAYTHFIAALCEMSHNLKRVVAKEKEVDNDKYAFRCFLLRLGFIGAEYKDERKILLRNLSGSSAFKSGIKATSEEVG